MSATYPAGFWYWYKVMRAKILTPKNADLLFFTVIFSIAHLCFFILTLTKTYFELWKQILPFASNVEKGLRDFTH